MRAVREVEGQDPRGTRERCDPTAEKYMAIGFPTEAESSTGPLRARPAGAAVDDGKIMDG